MANRAFGTRTMLLAIAVAALSFGSAAASPPVTLTSGSTYLGTQNVGMPVSATLTFVFNQTVSLDAVLVVTQGYSSGDFTNTGGSCGSASYYSDYSCTVQVTFQPLYPGMRMGAVVFVASGAILSTYFLQGIGTGPLPVATAGVTKYTPSLVPNALSVDGSGKPYLAAAVNSSGTQQHGLYEISGTTIETGYSSASAMAIDGAGNIYVSDPVANVLRVTTPALLLGASSYVLPRRTSTWTPPSGVTISGPLAVDDYGALYIADGASGSVLKFGTSGTQDTVAVAAHGSQTIGISAIAVDAALNVYVALLGGGSCFSAYNSPAAPVACNGTVWKVTLGNAQNPAAWTLVWEGTGTDFSGASSAAGLAIDGGGTTYVADSARNLFKVPAGLQQLLLDTSSYPQLSGWYPGSLAADRAGSLWVVDSTMLAVYELAGANAFPVIVSVNGACGLANAQTLITPPETQAELCNSGAASLVIGTGPWAWSCGGSNGGTTVSCGATTSSMPVDGLCGTSNGGSFTASPATGLCSAGTTEPATLAGSGPWSWSCLGLNGGAASAVCSAGVAPSATVNGACNLAATMASFTSAPAGNLCSAGVGASSVTGSGPWNWTCAGSNGGGTATCSARAASSACRSGTVTSSAGPAYPTPIGVRVDYQDWVYISAAVAQATTGVQKWVGGWQPLYTLPKWGPSLQFGGFDSAGNAYLLYYYTVNVVSPGGALIRSTAVPGDYLNNTLAVDRTGNAYVSFSDADSNWTVVKITPAGAITTIAGGGHGCAAQTDNLGDGCPATQVTISSSQVTALTVDAAGNLYLGQSLSPTGSAKSYVRKIDAKSGIITLFAGSAGPATQTGDGGPAVGAGFYSPDDLAVDLTGSLYIADGYSVRRVDGATGIIQTVSTPGVSNPTGIAVNSRGDLYVVSFNQGQLFKIAAVAGGNCVTVTPGSAACGSANQTTLTSPVTASALCANGSFPSAVDTSNGWPSWTCYSLSNGGDAWCWASGSLPTQTIAFSNPGTQTYGVAPAPLVATATSGLAVIFNSQSPSVCLVSGATVMLVAAGKCTIQATQAGNAIWAAATPISQSFQVLPVNPCDVSWDGAMNVIDVQAEINEALAGGASVYDLNHAARVNRFETLPDGIY